MMKLRKSRILVNYKAEQNFLKMNVGVTHLAERETLGNDKGQAAGRILGGGNC